MVRHAWAHPFVLGADTALRKVAASMRAEEIAEVGSGERPEAS